MPPYYSVIHGFDDYAAGDADSIVGLETPDDHTLVVELDEPASDLAYRLSLPAAAPLPEGAAEGHDEDYARFVVASGPYMVEGSDRLDFSLPPAEQEPLSGYEPPELDENGSLVSPGSLTLVRNPSWESSSDGLRAAYVDRMEFILGGDEEEMARDVDSGELDLVYGSDSGLADQVARYRQDPELSEQVFVDTADVAFYITMNLAVPPFDDVHVRRAVNLAIDKAPLLEMMSQPPFGPFGTSSARRRDPHRPRWPRGEPPAGVRPVPLRPGRGETGDASVRVRPRRGRPVRRTGLPGRPGPRPGVRRRPRSGAGDPRRPRRCWHRARSRLRRRLSSACSSDPTRRIPMGIGAGWGKDFPTGSGWFPPLFSAASLESFDTLGYTSNYSLLGATPRQLRGWGYSVTSVPSVEDRLGACAARWGSAQTECWAELDQYLMTEVVPWVPLHVRQLRAGCVGTRGRILLRPVRRATRAGPDRPRSRLRVAESSRYDAVTMSEHTERLEDLTKRIDAAKEFL